MKWLSNIDLNQNELDNCVLQPLGADPGSPISYQIYTNTSSKRIKQYNGSAWIQYVIAGSGTPSTLTVGGAASTGTATDVSHEDHVHAMPGLATTGASGFMSSGDKTDLTNATSAATGSTLVKRDSSGNASFNVLTTNSITISNAPSAGTDGVNKTYVDALVTGLDWKASCRVASTANVTVASAPSTIDGVTLASGDRILLKNQTTGSENGIYTFSAAASPLVRATDADSSAEVTANMTTWIAEGTANADSTWTLTTNDPITLGTTSLTFVQSSGLGQVTAGTGLSKSGNTMNANTTGASTGIDGSNNIIVRSTATTGQVLRSVGVSGNEATWGALDLSSANAVANTLGVGNGGTGVNSISSGGILLGAGTTSPMTVLAAGSANQVLRIPGGGGSPAYGAIDLSQSAAVTNQLPNANVIAYYRRAVRVVATSNITISAPGATIDGVSLSAGDRILLVNQSTGSQNGIWVWNSSGGSLTRPTDYAASSTTLAYPDLTVYVYAGTSNAGLFYRLTTTGAITIDTTTTAWSTMSLNASAFTGIIRKFATTGPASPGTSFVVSHSLGTSDVEVLLRDASTNAAVMADWVATDANTVTFTFAASVSANSLRATVIG